MNFKYEKKKLNAGYRAVIGCDEVGRGCLAGPVVAAAVVLPLVESEKFKVIKSCGIKDSKQLSPAKREELSEIIKENCLWSIAEVSSKEIDEINIHNASLLAMKKAVEGLFSPGVILNPSASEGEESQSLINRSFVGCTFQDDGFVYVDGKFPILNLNLPQEAIISGDNKVISIAAASIIAKVYRDELMRKFDKQYPDYGLTKHKGYATIIHRTAIKKFGITPLHRLTFCEQYLM